MAVWKRGFVLLQLVLLAGLTAASARADNWSDCTGETPERSIQGCTAIIDAGTDTAKNVATAYNNRGFAYYDKGEYDRAIADFDKAIALNPKYAKPYNNRGFAYYDKGEYGRAIADFDKAIALNLKYAKPYYNRGLAYYDKGEYARAIADYDKAIALNPKYAKPYYNRGLAYYDKGEYDRAIADYDRAIALNPKYAKAYNNRGIAYSSKGEYDRAIADYDKAIALNPKNAESYVFRSNAHAEKGDFVRAIADDDEAIRLNPTYAEAFNGRCLARALLGADLGLARADCDTALRLSSNEPNHLDSRGMVGIKQGLFKEAWADYDAALQKEPAVASYLYGRGIAALHLGRTTNGKADLAKAAKLDPNIAQTYAGYGVKLAKVKRIEGAQAGKSTTTVQKAATASKSEHLNNTNLAGGLISKSKTASAAACEKSCAANKDCEAFSFDVWDSVCFLKKDLRASLLEPSTVSGLKSGTRAPPKSAATAAMVRYRGKVFPGKGFAVARAKSFKTCEDRCQASGKCVAFSFVKDNSSCELFPTAPEYTRDPGIDSGVKRQVE
ncbi:MAG: tetratricopeptide repeat protein [Aestuariivirga sp.]